MAYLQSLIDLLISFDNLSVSLLLFLMRNNLLFKNENIKIYQWCFNNIFYENIYSIDNNNQKMRGCNSGNKTSIAVLSLGNQGERPEVITFQNLNWFFFSFSFLIIFLNTFEKKINSIIYTYKAKRILQSKTLLLQYLTICWYLVKPKMEGKHGKYLIDCFKCSHLLIQKNQKIASYSNLYCANFVF